LILLNFAFFLIWGCKTTAKNNLNISHKQSHLEHVYDASMVFCIPLDNFDSRINHSCALYWKEHQQMWSWCIWG